MKTQIFQRSSKFILAHSLWTDFYENFMNAIMMKIQFFHKIIFDLNCHFYVLEKFCDFLL